MKHVLVTGGAGFIGSNLAKMLVTKLGCKVTLLDNMFTGSPNNLQFQEISNEVEFITGNILDRDLLENTIRGKDTVFHLAAVTIIPSMIWPQTALKTNIIGTFNVLEASLKAGIEKIVYGSTSSVYGNAVKLPICEEDGLCFLSFYSASNSILSLEFRS